MRLRSFKIVDEPRAQALNLASWTILASWACAAIGGSLYHSNAVELLSIFVGPFAGCAVAIAATLAGSRWAWIAFIANFAAPSFLGSILGYFHF
ncbi:MAG TPA: hypothetical protein VHM90_09955 [Phycisphaerae bacterium]|jgi:hypothetical protein|nr:hypothetical protein [Phycisphaerae bacterium]